MDGVALILCEGAFGTGDGKTANGLVRHTERYRIAGVLDSRLAGQDAGEVLAGDPCGIPIFASLAEALEKAAVRPTHLVIGLAPEGGRLRFSPKTPNCRSSPKSTARRFATFAERRRVTNCIFSRVPFTTSRQCASHCSAPTAVVASAPPPRC